MRTWHISDWESVVDASVSTTVTSWSAAWAMCCMNTRTRSMLAETCDRGMDVT